MSFGISKTVPSEHGLIELNKMYDGSVNEYEFHMAGSPSKLKVGDYVYTIFHDELHGRLKIIRFVEGAVNPDTGKPRTLIYVKAPGERLTNTIPMKGHRGTRYVDGSFWPVKGK